MDDEIIDLLRQRLERIRATALKTSGYPVSEKQIDAWMVEVERLDAGLPVTDEGDWIIHGDYRAQNLKFDDDGNVTSILDLDTARPANRSFDLAYGLGLFPRRLPKHPLNGPPEIRTS